MEADQGIAMIEMSTRQETKYQDVDKSRDQQAGCKQASKAIIRS